MKKIFTFLVIMLVAFAAGFLSIGVDHSLSIGSFTKFLPKIEIIPEEIRPKSLTFVGDVLLARRVETYLDTYGSEYVYSDLPIVSSSTILIGNFEAAIPVDHVHTPDLTLSFSVDAKHVPALRDYGFQYVSLANNHSMDKGLDNFTNTQQILIKNKIQPVGLPTQLSTSSISYIELEGQKVALIGIHAVAKAPTKTKLQEVFEKASEQSDFQIAFVHWGIEYKAIHSVAQKKLAHTLIDAGADAVIGHHSHVVQDIELYDGVPIFYSLGNFIFDQYFDTEVQKGLWVELLFHKDSITYTLQGITSVGSYSVPRFMAAYENELFLKTLAKNSSESLRTQIIKGKITQ